MRSSATRFRFKVNSSFLLHLTEDCLWMCVWRFTVTLQTCHSTHTGLSSSFTFVSFRRFSFLYDDFIYPRSPLRVIPFSPPLLCLSLSLRTLTRQSLCWPRHKHTPSYTRLKAEGISATACIYSLCSPWWERETKVKKAQLIIKSLVYLRKEDRWTTA